MTISEFWDRNSNYFINYYPNERNIYKSAAQSFYTTGIILYDSERVEKIVNALFSYHLNDKLYILTDAQKYTQAQIDLLKQTPEGKISDITKFFKTTNPTDGPDKHRLQIVYVPQGISIIPLISEFPELKHVSMALQLHQKHKVRVFENIPGKNYTIFTTDISYQFYAMVLAATLTMFTDLFSNKEELIPIMEQRLNGNEEGFIAEVNKYFEKHQIFEKVKFEKLKKIFEQKEQQRLLGLENLALSTENHLNGLLQDYRNTFEDWQKTKREITAEKLNPKKDFTEIIEYLSQHKSIKIDQRTFNTSHLIIRITTPIEYYEADVAKTMLEKRSIPERLKKLLWETFVENKYRIISESVIDFALTNSTFTALSGDYSSNQLPHPHLASFNCFGNNKPIITKALMTNDYISAIEQTVATCKNLNFYDSAVIDKLIQIIERYYNIACFEDTKTQERISYQKYKILLEKQKKDETD